MKAAKGKGAARRDTKEALKPAEDRKIGKRKAAVKAEKSSKRATTKDKKAKKDPNKPKRPPSAFFVFLEEFRKVFKKENPNVKAVSAVGKAGGERWKSLSEAEKAPYEAKAAKKKAEYEKIMNAYNKKQESTADDGDEESDRSKSEVNDQDDEESAEGLGFPSTLGKRVGAWHDWRKRRRRRMMMKTELACFLNWSFWLIQCNNAAFCTDTDHAVTYGDTTNF
ncbi:High mobility group B protein 1 [Vitis vinifera]|uniref:High mobility group B protein 1 n=1 Tax=Vitis vinifera TaxID=29760 RepID=A0A438E9V4_VITVI|nr:High mobility group B protein 1 [Vitis vinifera]